jgi:hypothetical protein
LLLLSLEETRDYAIIAYAVAGTLAFVFILLVTLATGFLSLNILSRIRRILKDNVQPATQNVKATTENLRGTVSYISDTAVKPVVTVYGVAAGAKRFVGVVTKVTGRKKNEG